jgi:CHAD domain-containing protein
MFRSMPHDWSSRRHEKHGHSPPDMARENSHAAYAEPIELQSGMSAGEAFRAIARSTVRHMAANVDAVRDGDPEGIHQMRVGLRRMRTATSIFAHLRPRQRTGRVQDELKWLSRELASARELDVFVKQEIVRRRNGLVPRRGGEAIEKEFAAKRAEAFACAGKAVTSKRGRTLLVEVVKWIEMSNGRAQKAAQIPAVTFCSEVLDRRLKKIRKLGGELENLSPSDRHKFRIRVKELRYAAQFFDSLFPDERERKQLARLSRHLRKTQDALGGLNDFVAHRKLVAKVALKAAPDVRRRAAFASDVAMKPLLKTAVKQVRGLRQVKPF